MATGAKFSALVLMMIATGCNAGQKNPEVDESSAISTTKLAMTYSTAADSTTTNQNDPTTLSQMTEPQGEPGYIGYPLMGETAAGASVYYITSESIACADGDSGCVIVNFLQVDAADANQTADGQAVAQCASRTVTEVIIDGDLVAYEIASPDEAMTNLLNTACQANRPGEFRADMTPTVPEGLVEGMPYAEVRSRILDAGWLPKNTPMDHYTTLEQAMYDRGYIEVRGCSGTGLCRFEFNSSRPDVLADQEALIVITSFSDSDVFFEEDPLFGSANIGLSY
ncbi:MAG: hypothetical protein F6K25_13690 [Okeania sp. SIO2G4]|uniref:hypothetical protein n=1 Tax=unclassified Okeania TaxID=2634635 RepID=UPI0013BD66F6|nr:MULTISPECIES: hypothetical protein [unclassified Okeania]NEP70966.1 hypothetical protein [Okeania sp. SIO2G5]NEP93817.1 hypothetical protein [Okeania sp. SIO2F5]NEQ91693.1 hypothetical protein [Okeania sp. SIO2G4]